MRTRSDRPTRDGSGWIHLFMADGRDEPQTATRPHIFSEIQRAPIAVRDRAYSTLLSTLKLAVSHKHELFHRGIPDIEMLRLGYKSVPGDSVAADFILPLLRRTNLRGVPGFYSEGGRCRLVRLPPGFLIPYKDEHGRIEGLQIRRSSFCGAGKYLWVSSKGRHLGSSSGSPIHFAKPDILMSASEVVITEGALKADIVAYLTQAPVIAAAGVSNFPTNFAARLRGSFPRLRHAIVAFDQDLRVKPEVRRALQSLCAQLQQAGFRVRVRIWHAPAKGYDDFLFSQLKTKEVVA
ncbi:MAG: DUF3854 domain-containing protein [Pyrinomonadaceae bacterium]